MKKAKIFQILFLIMGTITAYEFIFVRGMFTWIMAVAGIIAIGALNVVYNMKNKEWLQSCLYLLSTVAFCMGYFALA